MSSHKFSRWTSRVMDRISISPRLIFILSLYVLFLASLALAILYAPLIVFSVAALAMIVFAQRAWIKRKYLTLVGRLRHASANGKQED